MQEARNLCSQRGRFQHISHRACGIEEFALELRWDRVPLHDDGRAEAAKNVLLSFGDAPAGDGLSSAVVLNVLGTDDLVEIIRQSVLVFGQRSETFLRSLKFADFARNVSMFERFGGFCRFCAKLFSRKHGALPACHAPCGFPLDGAVLSVCRMSANLHMHYQAELRRH